MSPATPQAQQTTPETASTPATPAAPTTFKLTIKSAAMIRVESVSPEMGLLELPISPTR